jgi:hypothetical protein
MKTNRFLSAAVLAAISVLVACSTNDTETTTIGQSSSGKGTEIVLPGTKSSSSSSIPSYVLSSSSHFSSSSHSSSSAQSSSSHSSSSQNSSSSVSSSSAAVEDPFAGWQVVTHNAFIDDWMTNERLDTATAYSLDGRIPTDGSSKMKIVSPRDINGSFTFPPAKGVGGGLCTGFPNTGALAAEWRTPDEYTFVRVYLDPNDPACLRD